MDGSQFDAWTRRGFGAAAGGLAGSLLALSALPGAEAKKKKKRKKCGKLGAACDNGQQRCCCGYDCQQDESSGTFCCRAAGFSASSVDECCSLQLEVGRCVCKTLGEDCTFSEQCCSGLCDTAGSDTCEAPPQM